MNKKKMVAVARVVSADRERILMLEPFGKAILGTLLHDPYEIRSEEAVFQQIPDFKLPDKMIGLAEELIDRMTGDFRTRDVLRGKQASLPAPKKRPRSRRMSSTCWMRSGARRRCSITSRVRSSCDG